MGSCPSACLSLCLSEGPVSMTAMPCCSQGKQTELQGCRLKPAQRMPGGWRARGHEDQSLMGCVVWGQRSEVRVGHSGPDLLLLRRKRTNVSASGSMEPAHTNSTHMGQTYAVVWSWGVVTGELTGQPHRTYQHAITVARI